MNVNWIENGWRRFLDRLKELWGKRDDPRPGSGLTYPGSPSLG